MIRQSYRRGIPTSIPPRLFPPNPLYVDTTAASGGTGTKDAPINSLIVAQTMSLGLPDWLIRVRAPASSPVRQEVTFETSMNVIVEGWDDEPWHAYGSEKLQGGWTGPGPVYSRALTATTVGTVIVTDMTETIGDKNFLTKLRANTSLPTTPNTGEWGYSGGRLYVRLPDDSDANAHTFEWARRNTCIATKGFGRLTIRDVDARYAIVSPILNGTTGQPAGTGWLTVEDFFVGYTGHAGNGITGTGQWEDLTVTNGVIRRVGNDGLNAHATVGLSPLLTANGVDSSYNGDHAGQSSQGASNHEGTRMILNGGRYDWNVSGGMVVIDQARCDIHGDTPFGPVLMRHNMRLGNTFGTISGQAGCAWLNDSVGTVTGPVTVSDGLGVGVKVEKSGAVAGAGNITSVRNALPDSIAR